MMGSKRMQGVTPFPVRVNSLISLSLSSWLTVYVGVTFYEWGHSLGLPSDEEQSPWITLVGDRVTMVTVLFWTTWGHRRELGTEPREGHSFMHLQLSCILFWLHKPCGLRSKLLLASQIQDETSEPSVHLRLKSRPNNTMAEVVFCIWDELWSVISAHSNLTINFYKHDITNLKLCTTKWPPEHHVEADSDLMPRLAEGQ